MVAAQIRDERYEIGPEKSDGIDGSGWARRQEEWRKRRARELRQVRWARTAISRDDPASPNMLEVFSFLVAS